jgi:Rieske 2Fe-2S family protein
VVIDHRRPDATGPRPAPIDRVRLERVLRPRPEASPLPPEAYVDPAVFEWELAHLFGSGWVCVGREEDAPRAGDAFTATVAGQSVLVVRGEDDGIRAFHNVCQHRGTRLVVDDRTSLPGRIICPYHSWTYGLDGRLRAAQHMEEARGFDRSSFGLRPVRTGSVHGWLFVALGEDPEPLGVHLGTLPDRIARFRGVELRRGGRRDYVVRANWKLLSENYQECYHCPTIHPELIRVTPYRSGERMERSLGPWLGGPMELAPGCSTMSISGTTDRLPIPGLDETDRRSVYYYTVLPNLWLSLHPDYVMAHTIWPLEADRTRIVCDWYFHPVASEAEGFDPGDAIEFWDLVNGQDWAACERVQMGIGSGGFAGGRFSDLEATIHLMDAILARSYLEGGLVRAEDVRPLLLDPARAERPA